MSVIEKSAEVWVPVRTAYDQWTQFEVYPSFMGGVERVEQLDDATLRWTVSIAGVRRTFETSILEQVPDERVAWRTTEGADHAGSVTFAPVDERTTRVTIRLSYQPERWTDRVGEFLAVVDRQVARDLESFRRFIEERGAQTGAWRGRIGDGEVLPDDPVRRPRDVLPPMTGGGSGDPPSAPETPPHVTEPGPHGPAEDARHP